MFKVRKKRFGDFWAYELFNSTTRESVQIIPEFGANVCKIVLRKANKLLSILDGDKSARALKKNVWFKGAKLVPFPNRIKDGSYTFNQKKHQLPINFPSQQHAIHGLIYNQKFEVKSHSASHSSAKLILKYSSNGSPGYPFAFTLTVTYVLDKKGFSCKTEMINTGKSKLPFGDGWHPYFTFGGKVDRLHLQIPSTKKINVSKRMIPTGKQTKFDKFKTLSPIADQRFDTGFIISPSKRVETLLHDPKSNATIHVWQEAGKGAYRYLQVFIPPARKSIAIEPMTCNTNAFNNKEGRIVLKPKEKFLARYGVFVK